jgi:hypothetical protein
MFIPIFFPINHCTHDDNDYEPAHASDCECNKCKDKAKIKYIYKRYYQSRYAVPNSFMFKHVMWRVLGWLIGLTGLFVAISGLVLDDYYKEIIGKNYFFVQMVVPFMVGLGIIIFAMIGLDKKYSATYLWRCEEKINLKKYNYEDEDKTWKQIIEKANVPKNYWISTPKDDWEYEV